MSISSSSETPSDHFCLRRKYLPASIKHFLGTMPTISDPVARRPRLLAASAQASNAACKGVSSIFVRFMETWEIHYSSTYHPLAFNCSKFPGLRQGTLFSLRTGFPDGVLFYFLFHPFLFLSYAMIFS